MPTPLQLFPERQLSSHWGLGYRRRRLSVRSQVNRQLSVAQKEQCTIEQHIGPIGLMDYMLWQDMRTQLLQDNPY